MKLIAHRGNINGPSDEFEENHPNHINEAITAGYDAEVDIWRVGLNWWLGHDRPQYKITSDWLTRNRSNLWLHCKNFEAMDALLTLDDRLNYFWHEEDSFALTSQGFVWSFPEVYSGHEIYAWCSDYVRELNET